MRLRCHIYEAYSSKRRDAVLMEDGGRYLVAITDEATGQEITEEVVLKHVQPAVGTGPRHVLLEDERALDILDPIPAGFLSGLEGRHSHWVLWLERFSLPKAALLVVVLAGCIFGVRWALPVAADLSTNLVPGSAEAYLGQVSFEQFEAIFQLDPSSLPADQRKRLRKEARALAAVAELEQKPEILFRKGGRDLGANAFAFPGGPIIVTDELVKEMGEDRLVLAVIAHELAHVKQRHGLRQVARATGAVLVMTVLLGGTDVSGVEELSTLVIAVASNGYSREFERDADLWGAEILAKTGRKKNDLADALEKLGSSCGETCDDGGFFSTHPGTSERIKALRSSP